jgi:hypothetical protein
MACDIGHRADWRKVRLPVTLDIVWSQLHIWWGEERFLDLVLQVDLIYSPVVWWTTRMYNYPAEL